MKLFAIYVGGEVPGGNIEVHDIRFVAANSLEETFPFLKAQWWGIPQSLHIDCWMELSQADGYQITLQPSPGILPEKLYYVNLGGYLTGDFTEQHKNVFVVAQTESKAKVRALKMVRHWQSFHRDDMYVAEQAFCINDWAPQGQHINLKKIEDESTSSFTCQYIPLGNRG